MQRVQKPKAVQVQVHTALTAWIIVCHRPHPLRMVRSGVRPGTFSDSIVQPSNPIVREWLHSGFRMDCGLDAEVLQLLSVLKSKCQFQAQCHVSAPSLGVVIYNTLQCSVIGVRRRQQGISLMQRIFSPLLKTEFFHSHTRIEGQGSLFSRVATVELHSTHGLDHSVP